MEVAGEMETLKFDNVPAPGSPSALGPQLEQESGGSEEQSPGLNEARGPGGSEEQGLGVNEAREPGGSEEQGLGVNEAREPGGSEEQGLGVNEAREPGGSEMEEMEVAAQLETLKFDNMPAPGSPSALGPQLAQEPGGSEARELGGSEEQGPGVSEARELGGSEEQGPGVSEARELGGSEEQGPGVSEARELGGSEEQGPGVSEARELGGSEEQGPGVSEARELGGSEEQGPGVSEARELGGSEEQGPGVSEARELGGSEEPGNVSPPAAEAAPGAEGLQEEQPGERSTDSDSDTDSDSSSSVSSCSLSTESAESCGHQNGKDNTSYHVKKKDELPLDQELPTVEDLTIVLPEDVELKPFGTISSILEQLVIIESLKGLPAVNEESIIFKADRHAAGKVFEIFGPVLHPFYVLQFNSPEHIEAKGIHIKDTVYFAPSVEDFTQYIFTEKLKQVKGSDASWKNDQEPPPEALDFSDDEMERQAKQKKKKPQNQRKKPRSEMNESSKSNGVQNQPVQQPTSNYSRGYCGREFNPGFSRDRFPHPSVHPSFSRPQLIPPYSYSSDHRIHQESAVFPQPLRHGNPMMPQYPFPPPGFGPVGNEMHHFPPPNLNMMWTRASLLSNLYNPPFPFPPPPPPPPPPPDSSNGQFDTHKYFHD